MKSTPVILIFGGIYMQVNIGKRIRDLRQKLGKTQNDVAEVLGMSPQAVSRWESGITYPDLELIPVIANYFGVTIDNLFGYQSERENKIEAILKEVHELSEYDNGVDVNIEKCLTHLRNGLAEFPGNERLMYELASVLSNAGWVRIGEHIHYDNEGYLVHTVETNSANEYWQESIKLFETLIAESKDPTILNDSSFSLTLLYTNLGQYEKGLAIAERMSPMRYSREMMRAYATDGREHHIYRGEVLLKLANNFANGMVQLLMSKKSNFDTDLAVRMLEGTAGLFEMIFEDGNMGPYHSCMCDILIYLSEHQWRCGMHDEAFASLDKALDHAKKFDNMRKSAKTDQVYTTPLLEGISMHMENCAGGDIAPELPKHWPMWMKPDFDDVYAEITADPRWQNWLDRTQEN